MTCIRDIRETKRGRYALFGDEGFLFSVDGETLLTEKIDIGTQMAEGALEDLRTKSDTRKAADQALRYLSLRGYGQEELYRKLLLKYDEHSSAAAVAKMVELGLLDDGEYARQRAEGLAQKGKSAREIRDKLAALGLARATVDAAVAALELDGAAAATALVQKQYMGKLQAGRRDSVAAALARRGFTGADIRQALEQATAGLQMGAEDMPAPWEGP